jgi:hypothetical protein
LATTIYSFADVEFIISHPSLGRYVANGDGIGSIKVTMTTDRTKHDMAADGAVMVTKVEGRNGTVALAIQQTSALDKWLRNAYDYVETASADQWAEFGITIRSPIMTELINAYDVSFQIQPERPFEADGQQVTWSLMSANIDQKVA